MDWPHSFDRWLTDLEGRADSGDAVAVTQLRLVTAELTLLTRLSGYPTKETASLLRVRQKRWYEIWRVSHEYVDGIAMRTICWFPPSNPDTVVVVFAGDKARAGDVFYDNIGIKADGYIEQYMRGTGERP